MDNGAPRVYCYYKIIMASWDEMHVISLRKAEPYEARYYLEAAEDYFETGRGP